jgi:hypothetical protein
VRATVREVWSLEITDHGKLSQNMKWIRRVRRKEGIVILLIKSSILWYPTMGDNGTQRASRRAGEKKEDDDGPSAASLFC